jgi:UDP-N-acetylmuramyl-tripeptide synthetase
MKLKKLISCLKPLEIIGKTDLDIKEIKIDSKKVVQGTLFVCISGKDCDGHNFVKEAERYGAIAIICEKKLNTTLTQIIVKDSRIALSLVSSKFYNNPAKKMKIIGVLGTNGKTTTSHMIYNILKNSGFNCGLIGTIGIYYNQNYIAPELTTPDPLELHKILYDMQESGVQVVVMEVSAHAIYYNKLYGVEFEIGVFTNFSQDHLDFFGNMENYKNTKLKFFENNHCKYIVTNTDDEVGRYISQKYSNVLTYGLENPADIFAIEVKEQNNHFNFVLNLFDCIYSVDLHFKGKHNVYNALGALTSSALVGVDVKKCVLEISNVKGVDGRLECVYSKDFSVYVDYAHTPDGLEKSLLALKKDKGSLICVFGCGGNRDNNKRAKMGEISGSIADFTVITSDNPRFEEPMSIIKEIEEGVLKSTKKYVMIENRSEAIEYALNIARPLDTVLIAGKGCEKYQEILGIKKPYNDKDTIEEILKEQ